MTEELSNPFDGTAVPAGTADTALAVPVTGHAEVDAVLASLSGLEEAEVATHVATFEQAHERLRGALDAPQT
ncbi:hypothetical protein [Nocardioides donggukensis]|uniref:Uncharacterized protein n=1 Tax=Nocardioides donggukensis TaxID=2774019 RepID=A0A927K3D6_9ACTN|nr:hypothetical protein [Nocardioides donggukensis]MBD8869272.1 hypothetical protein [Nocardioides donggukensis]